MKEYEYIGAPLKVYASSPNDASVKFCQEAEKLGIYLYEARKFSPDKAGFETVFKCFQKYGHSNALAFDDDMLVLEFYNGNFVNPVEMTYAVMPPKTFKKWYKLIENEPEPEMPSTKLAGKSFYLDAGHGGHDSGAVNNNLGLQEKIAALDVCLKLGELLEAQGAKIFYSRSGDTYPSLTERASEANAKNVTAFISIHLNSADNKSASGIETLVYSLKGTAAELAEKVQKNMAEATGWKNRGVKERPELTVLKKTRMPAILCEIGFISNDEQAISLFTPQMQNAIAAAIADGVVGQFGE